jgi:hypothetical protein
MPQLWRREVVMIRASDHGTIARTCAIISSLIRGAVHDRHTIARDFGVTVAAADRYVRELQAIPGVVVTKCGRRLTMAFVLSAAIRDGRGL